MVDFKILIEGTKIVSEKDGVISIADMTGSVSLVRAGGKIILVDSGNFWYEEKLVSLLEKESISVKDVDMVLLTHLHPDHAANAHLFKNSKVVENKAVLNLREKSVSIYRELSDIPLPEGVTLISVPGHMLPHSAVIVEHEGKKIVCAGDAIARNMADKNFSPKCQDIPKLLDSAIRICDMADVIIPGHGPAIEKEEITAIKNNLLRIKSEGGVG